MADIFHQFSIKAPAAAVFQAISTPAGLDTWWTKRSAGQPLEGATYELGFGPGHDWRAVVSRCAPNTVFEVEMTSATDEWRGTRVGLLLDAGPGVTHVRFHHTGWPDANEHYRISCHCWAMYLRLLRRYVEHGEVVPYEERLDA